MERKIIVSGGGTGIGKAVAQLFASSGDEVAIIGRRTQVLQDAALELNASIGSKNVPNVRAFPCDLEDPGAVTELARKLTAAYSSIDVLVNNAGGVDRSPAGSLMEIADSWMRDFRSNVLTSVMLTESLLPVMKSPGGRIINMSSIAALRGGGGSYSAAKSALIGWTFDLARSTGPKGITANVVAPGYISGTEFFGTKMTRERHERLVSGTLVGRPGVPEDVASMIYYLASEQASYVTGQVLQVNGGALLGR